MPRYQPYPYHQSKMIPIDYRSQLQPGTLEFALNHLVDEMDLSIFNDRSVNDETGAPAYDPAVLLKIVLLAYSRGITSSREIEPACRENVVFMALSADSHPHFTTIAKFISSMGEEIDAYVPDRKFRKRDLNFATAGRHKRSIDQQKTPRLPKHFQVFDFTYDAAKGKLICPAGKELYVKNRNFVEIKGCSEIVYIAKKTDCRVCALRATCLRKSHTVARQVTIFSGERYGSKSYTQRMIDRFDTPPGRFLYSRRLGEIEPVFANVCHALGLNRFSLQARIKVDIQWKLYCVVNNLRKVFRYSPRFA